MDASVLEVVGAVWETLEHFVIAFLAQLVQIMILRDFFMFCLAFSDAIARQLVLIKYCERLDGYSSQILLILSTLETG